jgi:hypothetical protein
MKIIEVNDAKTKQAFLDCPKILYKNDKNWTCPLDAEIDGIFDPDSNSCFNHGEAIRWILKDEDNQLIGRIAAFYDSRKTNQSYVPCGNIGFFECINNQEAANLLFDTAKEWLHSKGLKAMDGNTNFGENLFHWGLLVEGFHPQSLGMPYNFPYYKELFENYGFQEYFKQCSYKKDLTIPWPERQYKFAEFLASRPDYQFEHFKFSDKEKYIKDLVETYNTVWSDFHEDYTPLEVKDIEVMFDDIKDIIDEELIWFAYANGKCIGMVIGLPDINPVLRKLGNGKLNLINKLKFFYYTKINNQIIATRTIASGVVPEYQQKGVIATLFLQLSKTMQRKKHKFMELAWTGDYNEPVLTIYERVGAEKSSVHITYRCIFDKNIPFQRFTNEEGYKSRKK